VIFTNPPDRMSREAGWRGLGELVEVETGEVIALYLGVVVQERPEGSPTMVRIATGRAARAKPD
jgi:hypothetical protein